MGRRPSHLTCRDGNLAGEDLVLMVPPVIRKNSRGHRFKAVLMAESRSAPLRMQRRHEVVRAAHQVAMSHAARSDDWTRRESHRRDSRAIDPATSIRPRLTPVRQWEYTPTLLNGVPVPVVVTVTINFTP
jgi:hypothetical protein